MKTWTIDEMLAEGPCIHYTPERLAELYDGRESVSLIEILDAPIPLQDIVWCITRPTALTQDQCNKWGNRVAARMIRTRALNCGIQDVERWAQAWLAGLGRDHESCERAQRAVDQFNRSCWGGVPVPNRAREAATVAWYVSYGNLWDAAADAAISDKRKTREETLTQIQDCREILTGERYAI